ncbi:MAG: hypothetical protein GEU86_20450 [Actinophytocola sp.]|nr:hypothetical protein [Actinophytocola sp.]
MATAKSEHAQRARRWASRALLVLGGALAGSAAVWAVSTGTATAASLESDDSLSHSAERMQQWVADGEAAAGATVDRVEKTLRADDGNKSDSGSEADAKKDTDEPAATESGQADGGAVFPGIGAEAARGAATHLSALIGGLVGGDCDQGRGAAPVDDVDSEVDDLRTRFEAWFSGELDDVVAELPTDDFEVVDELPAPFGPPASGAAGAADVTDTVDVERAGHLTGVATDHSQHAASDDDASARDGGNQNFPSDGIPVRMPAGSPAAPSIPGTGLAGAGNTDGAPLAITHGSGNTLCAAMANKVLSGAYVAPVEPGRQPGVTPD